MLEAIFAPQSVAIVGASPDPEQAGASRAPQHRR